MHRPLPRHLVRLNGMGSRRTIILLVAAFAVSFAASLAIVSLVRAFNGPPSGCIPPGCAGAIGVNSSGNLSVGTSTAAAETKFLIVASSTNSSNYGLKVLQPGGTPIFVVSNDGFVGVGTLSPAYTLDVNGSIRASGSIVGNYAGTLTANNLTSGVFGSCGSCGGGNYAFPSGLGVATSTNASLPQSLSVYGGGYFSGNVGIGTSTPWTPLDVRGPDSNIGGPSIAFIGDPSGQGLKFGYDNTNGWAWIESALYGQGPRALNIDNSLYISGNPGNVGIGTTAPAYTLDVNGPIKTRSASGIIFSDGTEQGTTANFSGSANYLTKTDPTFPGAVKLGISQIYDNGTNVGIANTSPAYKLDVAGQIRSSSGGFVFPDGTTQATAANAVNVHIGGWCFFDGSTASIIGGYNCSSITRSGAGYYEVYWTNAFPNANYGVVCTASTSRCERPTSGTYTDHVYIFTTQGGSGNALQDDSLITVMAFY